MSDRTYTDQELEAAVAAIAAPGALRQAQDVVMRTAPSLQRLLASALADGGWFEAGHSQAVRQAAGAEDPVQREREVQTLVAEETRLGMLVGVAVGFQLARELDRNDRANREPPGPPNPETPGPPDPETPGPPNPETPGPPNPETPGGLI